MADKRIKGITVEIGGDTIGLNKALSGTNKQIRDTQTELRSVERLLKLDPTNTNLLEQRQKLLAKAVADTGSKLEAVKQAEKQAQEQFAKGEISEEAYRQLQREVVSTEQSLKKLEEQADKSNISLSKIATKAQDFGDKATSMGKKLAPMSAAAGAAAIGMGAMAVKAGQAADDINTLSKQTGLSVEQIQKFSFASDRIDVSMETLTGSMSKLTKNMATAQKGTGDAAKAFHDLKVNITNSDGSLRDNQEVFDQTIVALGKISNETQRDAYAMQIFGKSAQDLNPLILGGADALKQMGDEAEAAGLILSGDTLNSVNEFADEVDEMKAVAAGTFTAIGGEIAIALLPIMQELSKFFIELSKSIRQMDGDTLRLIVTILAIVAGLAPLLIMIGRVSTGIAALANGIMWLCGHPIVLLIAAIAAIVAGLVFLWLTNEDFRNGIISIWQSISDTISGVSDFIVSIFTEKIPDAVSRVIEVIRVMVAIFVEIVKAPFNAVISIINSVVSAVNDAIAWMNGITLPGFLGGGTVFSIGNLPTIPMLAKGGILSQGSAIVGERGAELLSVSGGRAVVQPLGSSGSATAVGNTYVTNNFTIDPSNLAEMNQVIKIFKGEQQSIRMGFVGG